MIIRQGFKFRLDTSDAQSARLRVLCGHARFVWNQALKRCNEAADTEGEYVPRYETMAKWVTVWKREPDTEWLKEAENFQLEPPPGIWERIDSEITPKPKTSGKKPTPPAKK